MEIIPTKKPTIKQFREWIAWRLVDLARWIWPKNEAAMSFIMERMMEYELELMKYGRSVIQIKVKKQKNMNA